MKILSLFLWLSFHIFAASAYAALCGEQPQADAKQLNTLLDLSMEELFNVSVEVASKKNEQLFDAPSSVTVFTRREISAMGVQSVEELLNFVPGFSSSREIVFGDGYMVSARGRTTPQASYNILFILDGQRLNNDRSGGALVHHRLISLHNVERVEVIRGPGSALYGTSAFSGVVNIITSDKLNNAYVGTGNFNHKEAYVNAAQSAENWQTSVSVRVFDDAGDTYDDDVSDPRQGAELSAKLCYQRLQFQLHHQQRRFDDFYSSNNNGVYAETATQFLRAQYRWLDTTAYSLEAYAAYSRQQHDIRYELLSAEAVQALPTDIVNGAAALLTGVSSEEREWQIGLEGRYQFNDQHELFAGFDWRQADNYRDRTLSNYRSADPLDLLLGRLNQPISYAAGEWVDLSSSSKEGKRDIRSLYVQDKYQIHAQWAATLGARYDDYSDFGGNLSPRLSLLYTPNDNSNFKLLYGEAFRAPSIRQLSGIPGNSELQAEKIKTLELAWLQKHTAAQSTLTWFYSRHSNIIDTRLRADGLGRQFQNVENTLDTAGWELEAAIQPRDDFSLRAAYSYLYKTEENPRRFPRQTVSVIANYHLDKWNFNLNAYYHGDVEQTIPTRINSIPAFSLVNAHVRYHLNKQWSLSAQVHNLFDEDYYSSVKPLSFSEGILNRGRFYSLGLIVAF